MIFLSLLYVFLAYLVYNYVKKFKNYGEGQLKGPMPLPIFGNLIQIGADKPHESLTKMHEKYGPIYRVWMGDVYTVVVNDIDILKKMLVTHFDKFVDRPHSPSFQFYSKNYKDLSLADREAWKEHREIVAAALTKTKMKHIYELFDQQVQDLLASMAESEKSGVPFQPRRYTQRFSMNTMLMFVFNKMVPYQEGVDSGLLKEILEPADEVFHDLGTAKLGDSIDMLKPFLTIYFKLANTCLEKVLKFIRKEYQEHLDSFKEEYKNNPRDFMDIMINEFQNRKEKLESIYLICLDLLLAGTDTTAGSIEWSFLYMANNPEIQEKAYKELDSVIGKNRNVVLSDRNSTPYVNALIKEIGRVKPIGAFGLPHACSEDIVIDGHFIPKGAQVLPNFCGISKNTKYWENPDEFNPNRFLGNSNTHGFDIFGWGPRGCVGRGIAQDELYLSIANILKKYKISSTDGKQIRDDDIFGLTIHPHTFNVSLQERV
ncbi:hypothetical protein CYY_003118 [Polysphondylium violaceum]|uniref:Cytochrome P450 family protein n=1 Tax=Polysphondylium violaceum TaxID=133409 RepID=A0A8J4PY73_9MYCE|nr:hypothetical protein CYY_003118 [Polysphondylium violaceum]